MQAAKPFADVKYCKCVVDHEVCESCRLMVEPDSLKESETFDGRGDGARP